MKKILICGATGFIGRNLLEHFKDNNNYTIRAVWNSPSDLTDFRSESIEWVRADLTKKEDVKKVMDGVDIVLQYAAISTSMKDAIEKPYIHVTDNVIINSLIFRYAYEFGVEQVVFPSCTVMYEPSDSPVEENDFNGVIDSENVYFGGGSTKVYLENMCKFYSDLGKTKFTTIRQSNIYGPYDKFDRKNGHFFSATIDKVINSDKDIEVWGDGSEKKDLLYVKDLTNFIELVITKQESPFELINLSSGTSLTITDIVQTIISVFDKDLKIMYDLTKPSRKYGLQINSDKARKLFGWNPTYDLRSGIDDIKSIGV